jgi:hypothetical protein
MYYPDGLLDDNTRRKAPLTNNMATPVPETASTTRIEFRVDEYGAVRASIFEPAMF